MAEILATPKEENDGIPPAGFPFAKICASSASVFRTTSGLEAISGPRSLPRASSPWHAAQTLS